VLRVQAAGGAAAAVATAARAAAPITSNSPAAIASRGAIHVPPIAKTLGRARYASRFEGRMPPVGMKRMPNAANGAVSEAIAAAPPDCSAGKNLRWLWPLSADAGQDYTIIAEAGGMKNLVVHDGPDGWTTVPNPRHTGYRSEPSA
jgi:hypothetical protein